MYLMSDEDEPSREDCTTCCYYEHTLGHSVRCASAPPRAASLSLSLSLARALSAAFNFWNFLLHARVGYGTAACSNRRAKRRSLAARRIGEKTPLFEPRLFN